MHCFECLSQILQNLVLKTDRQTDTPTSRVLDASSRSIKIAKQELARLSAYLRILDVATTTSATTTKPITTTTSAKTTFLGCDSVEINLILK